MKVIAIKLAAALLGLAGATAFAADSNWTGAINYDFNTAGNWDTNAAPSNAYRYVISSPGASVTTSANAQVLGMVVSATGAGSNLTITHNLYTPNNNYGNNQIWVGTNPDNTSGVGGYTGTITQTSGTFNGIQVLNVGGGSNYQGGPTTADLGNFNFGSVTSSGAPVLGVSDTLFVGGRYNENGVLSLSGYGTFATNNLVQSVYYGNSTLSVTGGNLSINVGSLKLDQYNAGFESTNLNATIDATGFSTINASNVYLGRAATLNVSLGNGFTPTTGTVYHIISSPNAFTGYYSGSFKNVADGGYISAGAIQFLVSYNGGLGHDLTLTVARNPGADSNWTGAINNDFNTAGNWDTNAIPSNRYRYVISSPGASVTTSANDQVLGMVVAATGAGSTLTITHNLNTPNNNYGNNQIWVGTNPDNTSGVGGYTGTITQTSGTFNGIQVLNVGAGSNYSGGPTTADHGNLNFGSVTSSGAPVLGISDTLFVGGRYNENGVLSLSGYGTFATNNLVQSIYYGNSTVSVTGGNLSINVGSLKLDQYNAGFESTNLNATIDATGFSTINASSVYLGRAATFNLSLGNGFSPTNGTIYHIISSPNAFTGYYSGSFKNLAEGQFISLGNIQFQASYNGGLGHDLTLTVTRTNSFTTWIAGYPSLTGANALPGADPDHDGISNLVEYALGLNPTTFNQLPNHSGNTLTFTKGAMGKADSNIAYSIEESTDLVTWGSPSIGWATQDADSLTYTFYPDATQVFVRLKVIQTP